MAPLTDLVACKAILDRDRPWAAYAISDLEPGLVDDCRWFAPVDGRSALLLLFGGFHPPIVFAMGAPADLAPLFHEIDEPDISLRVRPDAIEAMQPRYRPRELRPVLRMVVDRVDFRPAAAADVEPLAPHDVPAIEALYADGDARGEAPHFFTPSMLARGIFYGLRSGRDLVAVAGTHVLSAQHGVCAIGNVYTHHAHRRRGLGARTTSAVAADAFARGITTVVLNVGRTNDTARRVYERLGFRVYCEFFEGQATRVPQPGPRAFDQARTV